MSENTKRYGTCTACAAEIYQNLGERRSVDEWVHRVTGSKFCDRDELTTAAPATAAFA